MENREKLIFRNTIKEEIRSFFRKRNVTEVETPILQLSPGMELHLKAFSTLWENLNSKKKKDFYLHSSPEFAMKRLLSMGSGDIFQLARCFRNEACSPTHHPEFSLLEWYRVNMDYRELMEEVVDFVRACAVRASRKHFLWEGIESDPFQDWEKISVVEAFKKYAELDLLSSLGDGLNPSAVLLAKQAEKIAIRCSEEDSWEDIFFRIFLNRIEKKLGHPSPTILYHYPASMAALSRVEEEDTRFSRRFEVYVSGLELANAFEELQDPEEQRDRFLKTIKEKEELYGFSYPMDESFLASLKRLPPSSGIALGFDRLMMLLTGSKSIEEVLWLPIDQDKE